MFRVPGPIPSKGNLVTTETFNNSLKMQFSEVKQGLEEKSILLIDVRNPDEIRNMGRIPGSHNIPLSELKAALQLPEQEFDQRFGFPKPVEQVRHIRQVQNETDFKTCRKGIY